MSTRRRLPRRSVLTPAAVVRLLLGWGAVAALTVAGSGLAPPVPAPLLVALLVGIVGVIVACAFGVVHELRDRHVLADGPEAGPPDGPPGGPEAGPEGPPGGPGAGPGGISSGPASDGTSGS